MEPLEDGVYDVIVVDAANDADSDPAAPTTTIELAISSGVHRGHTVSISGPSEGRDPLDLLGIPGVLAVTDGTPRLTLEA